MRPSAVLLALVCSGCARDPGVGEHIEGEVRGVRFVVRLAERLSENERALVHDLVATPLERVLAVASSSLTESDVSRLNRAEAGVKTPVSDRCLRHAGRRGAGERKDHGRLRPHRRASGEALGVRVRRLRAGRGAAPRSDRPRARPRRLPNLVLDDDAIAVTKRIGALEVDLVGPRHGPRARSSPRQLWTSRDTKTI